MSTWIIPCNVKYYDIFTAFNRLKKLNWKQSTRIEIGDIVYIYVGKPYSSILYKCKVNKVNLPSPEIDDNEFNRDDEPYGHYGNYMELELMDTYASTLYTLDKLKEYGLIHERSAVVRGTVLLTTPLDNRMARNSREMNNLEATTTTTAIFFCRKSRDAYKEERI